MYTITANAVRKQTYALKRKYGTVEKAEEEFGLLVEGYLEGPGGFIEQVSPVGKKISEEIVQRIRRMNELEVEEAILEGLHRLKAISNKLTSLILNKLDSKKVVHGLILNMGTDEKKQLLDELYLHTAETLGLDTNPSGFGSLSLNAMHRLQKAGKNNLVIKYCQCIFILFFILFYLTSPTRGRDTATA